jgi:hypothetical protein
MAKRMLCLFLAVSFFVCCAGCNGKKTDEAPVSNEPVIGEEAGDITKEQIDGVTFVHEKYLLFEVEYPLLECSIQEVNYADGDAQVVYFAVRQKYETSQTPVYLELYTLTLM